jgi:hypothetical protein
MPPIVVTAEIDRSAAQVLVTSELAHIDPPRTWASAAPTDRSGDRRRPGGGPEGVTAAV